MTGARSSSSPTTRAIRWSRRACRQVLSSRSARPSRASRSSTSPSAPCYLDNIQVVNTTPLEPGNQVTLDANSVSGFQFSVNHDFKPTTITVEETGQGQDSDPRIWVDGTVNNPIGITNITDLHGDIFSGSRPTCPSAGSSSPTASPSRRPRASIGYDAGAIRARGRRQRRRPHRSRGAIPHRRRRV